MKFFSISFLFSLGGILFNPSVKQDTYTHLHIVDYDHPISFTEIKAKYTAYDAKDKDITDWITFESPYEDAFLTGSIQIKDYPLIVLVTNSRNITVQWVDEISVRDFTAPTIEVLDPNIYIDLSKEDLLSSLQQKIKIQDNWNHTEELEILWLGLEECFKGAGSYLITCQAKDQAGNLSIKTIELYLTQSLQEQIISDSFFFNRPLTEKEFLVEFFKVQPIDSTYEKVEITSNYFQNTHQEGIYGVTLYFTYKDGNVQKYQCKIVSLQAENTEKEINLIIYIALGFLSILILLSFFIYFKRS